MDLKEVLKNKRIVFLIIALAFFGLLLVLAFLSSQFSVKVVSITPEPGITDVPTNTKVEILFNRSINANEFKAEFTPAIEYSLTVKQQNKLLILKPKYALSANQFYQIQITNPVNFKSTFATIRLPLDQMEGQTYGYPEQVKQIEAKEKEENKGWYSLVDVNAKLPVKQPAFEARYVGKTNVYVVKMLGNNEAKSKEDFLVWVKSLGADPNYMDILYTSFSTPDFTIAETNIQTPTSILSPIKITFTDPVILSSAESITLAPSTPAFFNWNRDLNILTVVPQPKWQYGTNYQLRIPASIRRESGETLGREYKIDFKTENNTGI